MKRSLRVKMRLKMRVMRVVKRKDQMDGNRPDKLCQPKGSTILLHLKSPPHNQGSGSLHDPMSAI